MSRATSAVFFAVVLAGCPGTLDHLERFADDGGALVISPDAASAPPVAAAAPCPDVPRELFVTKCTEGCHSAIARVADLDLESPDVATRLVRKRGVAGSGVMIDPDRPEESLIHRKMTRTPPYGAPMPTTPLADEVVDCVRRWAAGVGVDARR